ncbi:MAG: arylsulfatase A-like enzyme, partial [Planctomycetota bacterium]
DSHLVQNIDIAPTFLEAAGLPVPPEMQGLSLMPILLNDPLEPFPWRESIYYRYSEAGIHAVPRHYGVRTERHKLIHYHGLDQWELFDLMIDPDELHNLYGEAAAAELQAELTLELQRLRRQLGDED